MYHVKNAIKLGQYNVGRDGDILTIPLYMGFLVNDKLADVIIPDVDVSALNNEEWKIIKNEEWIMKNGRGDSSVRFCYDCFRFYFLTITF